MAFFLTGVEYNCNTKENLDPSVFRLLQKENEKYLSYYIEH